MRFRKRRLRLVAIAIALCIAVFFVSTYASYRSEVSDWPDSPAEGADTDDGGEDGTDGGGETGDDSEDGGSGEDVPYLPPPDVATEYKVGMVIILKAHQLTVPYTDWVQYYVEVTEVQATWEKVSYTDYLGSLLDGWFGGLWTFSPTVPEIPEFPDPEYPQPADEPCTLTVEVTDLKTGETWEVVRATVGYLIDIDTGLLFFGPSESDAYRVTVLAIQDGTTHAALGWSYDVEYSEG